MLRHFILVSSKFPVWFLSEFCACLSSEHRLCRKDWIWPHFIKEEASRCVRFFWWIMYSSSEAADPAWLCVQRCFSLSHISAGMRLNQKLVLAINSCREYLSMQKKKKSLRRRMLQYFFIWMFTLEVYDGVCRKAYCPHSQNNLVVFFFFKDQCSSLKKPLTNCATYLFDDPCCFFRTNVHVLCKPLVCHHQGIKD